MSTPLRRASAAQTRNDVFSALAGTPTLPIGTHFAGATAGRVVRDGDAAIGEVAVALQR
jgi:hypothetical protein